jgi:hypothetical protein
MWPFLSIPIQERLILLSLFDQSSMVEIKAALAWAKETDLRLSSPRMLDALAGLRYGMEHPPPGSIPAMNRRRRARGI